MIKVYDMTYIYPKSQKLAVSGVNFEIEKGEIFGFLGPSGAGKTTTQRVIIGLLRGYQGSVSLMGKERRNWGSDFFERVGVAFDFPNLYLKLTAKENLNLISSYYSKSIGNIDELLDRVGLLKDSGTKVENFSKGMKMRLNFIRSLMHDPDLLFFDEPTSGLDPVNAKTIKDSILELKSKGKTVFLTTHNMEVAEQLCDRVAFIVDGKLSVVDSPKELMYKHGEPFLEVTYLEDKTVNNARFDMKGLGNNKEFQRLLLEDSIKTIHSQEATLEEVFIKLTGRGLSS